MKFNERLRYLIECKEIKIKDLAPQISLSASTLSNYAQGTREPDYETLKRIADYFGVTTDYLLGHNVPDTGSEQELLTLYRNFSPRQKEFILQQARLLRQSELR